ncbi:hypothetical protein SDC9_84628 [bioreactor metagenome]|uniref:Uncharacterized protein n=1 Tax=bioreactor metagenome TaxID=1076179 RepID=A0A644ZAS5_9ZZZZ
MVCKRSFTVSSAISDNCNSERVGLSTVTCIIGSASASALATVGGSASRGKYRIALETLSRTSLAAVSKSTLNSNSTVILEFPWLLWLISERIPGIPLMFCSSGSVIWFSITSAFAPGYPTDTVMMGLSTLGYSRTARLVYPITPKMMMISTNTVAKTGRFILSSDNVILLVRWFGNYF